MFDIKQWIKAAVLVSLSGLYAQPELEEGASFNQNLPSPDLVSKSYVQQIMNKMAHKGGQYLQDNNITAKQILVITVFSAREVGAEKGNISNDMIKFLPNEDCDNLPDYFYTDNDNNNNNNDNKSVHGEILAIYFKNTTDELLSRLSDQNNSNDTRLPYVFIFSHYIPCACLPRYPYSCAEELANLGRVNRNRYKIIVGYRNVWSGTNLTFAENLLREGGIHTAMNIASGQVLEKGLKIQPEIYQDIFTECLTKLTEMPSNNAACFINVITKDCTSGKGLYGYMTQFTKVKMHKCVEEYVKGLPLELYARYCSLGTLYRTVRLMLGRPTSMSEASWTSTPDDLNWTDLYMGFPVTKIPEFTTFIDSSENLKIMRKKCDADKKITESKGLFKNLYQNEKLKILITDIKQRLNHMRHDWNVQKEEKRVRGRENLKKTKKTQRRLRSQTYQ